MSDPEENLIAAAITGALGHDAAGTAIVDVFRELSSRWRDDGNDPITIVDAVELLAKSNRRIADAITPNLIGTCPTGGHNESLTEAVMGLTKSMMLIADAINNVASAIERK